MNALLIIALGGGLGSAARYALGGWVLHHTLDWKFPLGTFAVNIVGCLVAGVLAGLAEKHGLFSEQTRLLLFTGLLGGFTTFSAFGLETVHLLRRGEMSIAVAYVLLSVVCGVGMLALGVAVVRWLSR